MSEIKTLNGYTLVDTEVRQNISQLTEDMEKLHRTIIISKQNTALNCSTSFADAVKMIAADYSAVSVFLGETSMNTSTMELTTTSHRALAIKMVRSLTTNSVSSLQFNFMTLNGTVVTYQMNPDDTITQVTT